MNKKYTYIKRVPFFGAFEVEFTQIDDSTVEMSYTCQTCGNKETRTLTPCDPEKLFNDLEKYQTNKIDCYEIEYIGTNPTLHEILISSMCPTCQFEVFGC